MWEPESPGSHNLISAYCRRRRVKHLILCTCVPVRYVLHYVGAASPAQGCGQVVERLWATRGGADCPCRTRQWTALPMSVLQVLQWYVKGSFDLFDPHGYAKS
eukprot:gene22185-biopygen7178